MIQQIDDSLVIDYRAREWCKLPYPLHPKGCPNYNKKQTCPPVAPLIGDFFDLSKPLWFLSVTFDLKSHAQNMKAAHPRWTDRQAKCVLYWQPKVVKELKAATRYFLLTSPTMIYTFCPEAMGVHVIRTGQKLGIDIKSRPQELIYKVAFIGMPNKNRCRQMVMEIVG